MLDLEAVGEALDDRQIAEQHDTARHEAPRIQTECHHCARQHGPTVGTAQRAWALADYPIEKGSHPSLVCDGTGLTNQAVSTDGARCNSSHAWALGACWVVDEPDLELIANQFEVDQQVSVSGRSLAS